MVCDRDRPLVSRCNGVKWQTKKRQCFLPGRNDRRVIDLSNRSQQKWNDRLLPVGTVSVMWTNHNLNRINFQTCRYATVFFFLYKQFRIIRRICALYSEFYGCTRVRAQIRFRKHACRAHERTKNNIVRAF